MKHNYEYAEGRVIIKPLEKEDIEDLRVLRNKARYCFLNTQIISSENQEIWYKSYLKNEKDYMFKIAKKEKPEAFIGAVAVYDIDSEKKCAEFGRLVIDKEKAPEKGLGYEAVKAVCKFAFCLLGLHKIRAVVLKENERALSVYTKVGFYVCEETDTCYLIEITREQLD